jgi:hypothetical protein
MSDIENIVLKKRSMHCIWTLGTHRMCTCVKHINFLWFPSSVTILLHTDRLCDPHVQIYLMYLVDTDEVFIWCQNPWHINLCNPIFRYFDLLCCFHVQCHLNAQCYRCVIIDEVFPRICSTCRKHFPVFSSFMTYHRVCN